MRFSADSASKHRAVLFTGDDAMARSQALSELLEQVSQGDKDAIESIDANEQPVDAWFGLAAALPMFSDYRIVVVRHLLRTLVSQAPKKDSLKSMIEGLPDTARLIIVTDDEPGDDQEQRHLADNRQRWSKLLAESGASVFPFETKRQNLADVIRGKFHERGKSIDRKSATLLAQMTDFNTSSIETEIEKLIAYTGERTEVTDHDVETVVAPELTYNVFRLVETAIMGEAKAATGELHKLLSSARTDYGVSGQILTLIRRQLHLMWQARLILDNRANGGAQAVQHLFPKRYNLMKERDFSRTKATNLAKRTSLDQLQEMFVELARTDARIKGNEPGSSAKDELEQLILRMCRLVAYQAASR